ncbi:hypothetical protein JOD18_001539 [Gracilibacillus alcaliphilus]|nr:hypothetical protein [Gracilibacillus alcaliphilus]
MELHDATASFIQYLIMGLIGIYVSHLNNNLPF